VILRHGKCTAGLPNTTAEFGRDAEDAFAAVDAINRVVIGF